LRFVRKGFAKAFNRGVDAAIEVDKSVGRPKFLAEFFAGDQVARMCKQESEYLKGLVLELQADAVLVQLTRTQIDIVNAEAQLAAWGSSFHGNPTELNFISNCMPKEHLAKRFE